MGNTLPIFNEVEELVGTLTVVERKGRKKMVFRADDGLIIDMPNIQKFLEYVKHREIPQEQINKALKFFQEHIIMY